MAAVNTLMNNSAWGRISRKIQGRVDLPVYQNGWAYSKNFIFHSLGYVSYRRGTKYFGTTKSNQVARLELFDFGLGEAYVLEFTNLKIRVMTLSGFVLSGGNQIEITSPYTTADLFDLQFAQSYNRLYIAHKGYAPRTLVRNSATSFTLSEVDFICGPIDDKNTESTFRLTPSGLSGSITITASSSLFAASDVGRHIILKSEEANPWTYGKITAFTSATVVTITILGEKLANNNATPRWAMGAFYPGNYPGSVCLHQQRIVYGGTTNDPLRCYLSKTGLFDDFTPDTDDDDAFNFSVNGQKVALITFISSTASGLVVGTNNGVFPVRQASTAGALTATSINTSAASDYTGSAAVQAINVGNSVIYVDRKGNSLRNTVYDAINEGFSTKDLNLVADDVLSGSVVQLAYSSMNPDIVWAVCDDGSLSGVTFLREENISCWHIHDFDGEVQSICSYPQAAGYDVLFLIVKRVIDGTTQYYIETMEPDGESVDPMKYFTGDYDDDHIRWLRDTWEVQKTLNRLDCASIYDGTVTTRSITLSAKTGAITITASGSIFSSGNVGDEIWVKSIDGIGYGRAVVTGYTSNTVVSATVTEEFNSTTYSASGWFITAQTFTGLSHLEGKTVTVLADGGVDGSTYVVDSGSITISSPTSYAIIGLPYTGILKSLPLEGGGLSGTSQTKPKNVTKIGVRFYDTNGCKMGTDPYNLSTVEFRTTDSYLGRPPALFSGDYEIMVRDKTEISKGIVILQDAPQPCNILLLTPYFKTSDGG